MPGEMGIDFQYEFFSSIKQKKVEWLWYPYIPYGKLTVLQSDPGEGKSTFILNVASLLTRGAPMPDGYKVSEPQTVVYQCAEDNVADTVKPRLLAAEADCDKIAYIIDESGKLTLEDERIEQAIMQTGAKLLILDPLQAFLAQDGDMQSACRMRGILGKLATIAAKHQCAIVLIGHMNKGNGGKNLYRGLGSIDIAAIARSVLMIFRDKSNSQIRYMVPIKSSLAPEGPAIGFLLDSDTGFQWIGPCDIDMDDTEQIPFVDDTKKAAVAKFLIDLLQENDSPSTVILSEMNRIGISRRTVFNAKKDVGVLAYRRENSWYWKLPKDLKKNDDSISHYIITLSEK
jgi:hypothetical protein